MIITALTALLVLISLGLVVTVPVALATPGEWETSKGNFDRAQLVGSCQTIDQTERACETLPEEKSH